MSLSDPEISVVVSARDSVATIERAVRAMLEQVGAPSHEVIVVDNASNDETGKLAAAAGAEVLRLADRAGGPGAARNAGVEQARGAVIAFTDADCFPAPSWLAGVAEGFEQGDLVSGPVLPDPTADRTHWDRTIAVRGPSPLYATANLAVRRQEFRAAGGFRDWLTHDTEAPAHPYGEDTVLAWKLIRRGARAVWAPEAVVHHAVFPEGPWRWIDRHREMEYLPELVRKVPELRGSMLLGGVFASKRTLATSLAVAGAVAAVGGARRAGAIATLPALWLNGRRVLAMGPAAGAIWAGADVASVAALVRGSVRARTLVL